MSVLGSVYERAYATLCGRHPDVLPWHFQWLFLREAHRWQRARMRRLTGRVLDVGCGDKPYADWIVRGDDAVTGYVGLDVYQGPGVDIVVSDDAGWPVADASFDAVLFTQTLEHVADADHVVGEISRVLKPGGTLLVTVPFLMPAHGLPDDYRRLTTAGVARLFAAGFDIVELVALGRAGAAIGNIFLTFLEGEMNASLPGRLLKGLLLPLWIVFAFAVNLVCFAIDQIDWTGTHYTNVGMLARRKQPA